MSDAPGREDAEKLLQSILPLAKTMLAEHGEFYPYGGYMTPDGTIVHAGAKIEGTDHPDSQDLVALLRDNFETAAREGTIRASAMVFNVWIRLPGTDEKGDAIQACLDHHEGYSAEIIHPYAIGPDQGVAYGRPWAQRGARSIFPS